MSEKSPRAEARKLAQMLRRLARELEDNPVLATRLLGTDGAITKGGRSTASPPEALDLYAVFASGGESQLREAIQRFDIPQLRRIVQRNGLDSSKLAEKWRNKERLMELIVRTVMERAHLGDVFRRG